MDDQQRDEREPRQSDGRAKDGQTRPCQAFVLALGRIDLRLAGGQPGAIGFYGRTFPSVFHKYSVR